MERPNANDDCARWVEGIVQNFITTSSDNTLGNASNEQAWTDVLVGFSRGDDPLYEAYKEHVGPFHFTPAELFNATFPGLTVSPTDLTVISWILPQRESTKLDNRYETRLPSERWARARVFGEYFNNSLRNHLVKRLREAGIAALAPVLSPLWERKMSERFSHASNWSERHAAYAAGLGTFGLSDGLITPMGKAVRVGSVIASIPIRASERPYGDHRAYCLFFSKGICKKCIRRCPVAAISEIGHDKERCRTFIREITAPYIKKSFGFDGYACGLCQTAVPCESKIPNVQDLD